MWTLNGMNVHIQTPSSKYNGRRQWSKKDVEYNIIFTSFPLLPALLEENEMNDNEEISFDVELIDKTEEDK